MHKKNFFLYFSFLQYIRRLIRFSPIEINQYKLFGIEINPNYAEALSNKGLALGRLGKYDPSIQYFDRALKIDPNCAKAWSGKGTVLGFLRTNVGAIECFDKGFCEVPVT